MINLLAGAYPAAYQTLYEAKPITCSVTGTTFDAVPAPCAVILDVSLPMYYGRRHQQLMIVSLYLYFQLLSLPQLRYTRAVSGCSVPIISCAAVGAADMIRGLAPESMGGAGDIGPKIDAEVARTGLSADEIGPKVHISYHASRPTKVILYLKIVHHIEGKLIRIPGLPVMYDYEFFPQKVWPI